MLIDLSGPPSNPSSIHSFGQHARKLLQEARQSIAAHFSVKPEEIFFTSGGTEGLNFLIRGLNDGPIITTNIEHSSVYKTIKNPVYVPVSTYGAPLPSDIEKAITPETRAIFLSAANGETGVKIDIHAIAAIAQKHNIPLFLDLIALIGKDSFEMHPGITGFAISAHKFHGPKGIGAVFLRSSQKLPALLTGGGQEHNHRAGTENLAGILGLAEALKILTPPPHSLRDHFESQLSPYTTINGTGPRVSNVSNLAFPNIDGETLLLQLDLDGIAASHGSACSSGALEPSRVLLNMGLDRRTARSSLRFSFSRMNTREEIDEALSRIIPILKKLKTL
jgi:cysteine desulfurase